MTIEFVGTHHGFGRVVTGNYSFDQAFRADKDTIGFPTRTLCEFYGPTGVGKSTLCTDLLGRMSVSLDNREIACADLENQDENMISSVLTNTGFRSKWHWVNAPSKKGSVDDRDEIILQSLLEYVNQESPCLGLLDSVASIASTAEVQGDIGDANMGRRAFPMAQFCRRAARILRSQDLDSCILMTNHWYEKMGTIGPAKQYTSPGGNVKENMSQVRVQVKLPYVDYVSAGEGKVKAEWEGAWVLEGKVEKNRTGIEYEKFQVFIYGGWGVHQGMTAVIDCLASGLATIKAGKVQMDGQDFGLLKKIIEKERDNLEFFTPFYNALRGE
jgi:hypothetical protein